MGWAAVTFGNTLCLSPTLGQIFICPLLSIMATVMLSTNPPPPTHSLRDTLSEIRARSCEAAAQWLCRSETQSFSGLSCSVISCFRTWSAHEVTECWFDSTVYEAASKHHENDSSTCCAQYNTRRSQSGLSVKMSGATRRHDPTPSGQNQTHDRTFVTWIIPIKNELWTWAS